MSGEPSFRYDPTPGVEPLFEEEDPRSPAAFFALMHWWDRRHPAVTLMLVLPVSILALLILVVSDLREWLRRW